MRSEKKIMTMNNTTEIIHGCDMCAMKLTQILFKTNHFYVALDLSPIVEGHLMIISNNHIGCAAETNEKMREEFINVKEKVGKLVRKTYGKVSYYEHGRAGHCLTMSNSEIMCNHFHLHALPIDVDIHEALIKNYLFVSLKMYADIFLAYERYGSYLYFESSNHSMGFYPASDKNVQTHLLRTLICNMLLVPQKSNWETAKDKKTAEVGFKKYNAILKETYSCE